MNSCQSLSILNSLLFFFGFCLDTARSVIQKVVVVQGDDSIRSNTNHPAPCRTRGPCHLGDMNTYDHPEDGSNPAI